MRYRHCRLEVENIIYNIRDELLRPPGISTEQRQGCLYNSLVANKYPMLRSKGPLPLYLQKESSMQLQTRTGANPCKRKPEHEQRRYNLLYCCDGHHDWTEGKSHDHQHAKRAHRMNRRALGIKDKMLACASTRGVCRDNNMKGQLCRMNDRSDINYSQG